MAVIETERRCGCEHDESGSQIQSRETCTSRLRFIQVQSRVSVAPMITVRRSEIVCALTKPQDISLGTAEFQKGGSHRVHYRRQPFQREPDFAVMSVNPGFGKLSARAEAPGADP